MSRALATLSGLALVLLASCSPSTGEARSIDATYTGGGSTALSANFLQRIADAPDGVAYSGLRRVTHSYTLHGELAPLAYTERVWTDGHGGFAIDPDLVEKPVITELSGGDLELFAFLQKQREAFFHRHRDFRIRDLAAFTSAYQVTDTGADPVVAGMTCDELVVRRIEPGASWYRLAVEPASGLVLRSEELGPTNQVLALVEFLEIDFTPDLTGVPLHTGLALQPLDLASDTTAQLGFVLRVPQALPAGFALRSSETILDDGTGRRWARLVYGDGVEQVFFLHTDLGPGAPPPTDPASALAGKRSVRVFQVGPWSFAQGFLGRQRMTAVGKVPIDALLLAIDSARPL